MSEKQNTKKKRSPESQRAAQKVRTLRNALNRQKATARRVERRKAAGTWEPYGSLAKRKLIRKGDDIRETPYIRDRYVTRADKARHERRKQRRAKDRARQGAVHPAPPAE